jgi:hypothetical protein
VLRWSSQSRDEADGARQFGQEMIENGGARQNWSFTAIIA